MSKLIRILVSCFILTVIISCPLSAQGTGTYWDQSLNCEASLLSGAVIAGEGGIAAIYYNPATIADMKKNNLSLSANLFSLYFFKAENALGSNFPGDRLQFDVYPRIITLTLNPRKIPELTIEMAFFTKASEYLQINTGTSLAGDFIASNPGEEFYTGEYYLRSQYEDYYGGAGFGYKVTEKLALGITGMVSYKSDQYFNLINASAFTTGQEQYGQYLADAEYQLKYNMYDVRFITKLGLQYKTGSMSFGANINIPSLNLFSDGTVLRQYKYSNIHIVPSSQEGSNLNYSGRQTNCKAHFKDPLSVAAGLNIYSPSGNSILLFTAEYFFGIPSYKYIEAFNDNREGDYDFSPENFADWLTFTLHHDPVFNAGLAFKQSIKNDLMFSGGFRTDFRFIKYSEYPGFLDYNKKSNYNVNIYHFNYGFNKHFKRGTITLGMQFSYGRDKNEKQIVNLITPVEYINSSIMPLTGNVTNNVTIQYVDISVYFGFLFNFLKGN